MRRAWWLLLLGVLAGPAWASGRVTFHMPTYSMAADGTVLDSLASSFGPRAYSVPALVKWTRFYLWNERTHLWASFYWLIARPAGRLDGHGFDIPIPDHRCAPGDSCGFQVSVYDSVGNHPPDVRVFFRAQ